MADFVEVDPAVLGPSNLVEEGPGVWSVNCVGPESQGHLDIAVKAQLENDPELVEMCKAEIEVLKAHDVLREDFSCNPEKLVCIFPTRTVIFKLSSGGVLVFSPSKILEGMMEFIDDLGGVKMVMAAHKFNLPPWQETWPEALWVDMIGMKDLREPDCRLIIDPVSFRCTADTEAAKAVFEDFEVFGCPHVLVGETVYDFLPVHKASGVGVSADMLYTALPSGDRDAAGIGYKSVDPVVNAVRSLWQKSCYERWGDQLPSPLLPMYRVYTSKGYKGYSTGRWDFEFDKLLAFVDGAVDHRNLVKFVDAVHEQPMAKMIPCHTMCTTVGHDVIKEVLQKSWAFARELRGQRGSVDFDACKGLSARECAARAEEQWREVLTRYRQKLVIVDCTEDDHKGDPVDDKTIIDSLAGKKLRFSLRDASKL